MPLRSLTPLFGELGDLKRITSAGRSGSIATRLFAAGWGALIAGQAAGEVALAVTARAAAAARLGDLDGENMAALGLPSAAIAEVTARALGDHAAVLDSVLLARLIAAPPLTPSPAPAFAAALAAQPRAGITTPGRPRVVLEPPESHAEHCLVVAVYGVLLSPVYGADPATVLLMSFGHHLHNALMPDSGFTGEMLLGDRLVPAMAHATEQALAELPPALAGAVRSACAHLADAATPEARAFHAADAADRVLQIEQYLRPARLTMAQVLGECELVHAGPVKAFQDAVLAEMGLA